LNVGKIVVLRLVVLIGCALVFAGDASGAGDFVVVVLVGGDGASTQARLPPHVIDGLFDLGIMGHKAPIAVNDGYLKIYPVADGGFPGAPGRYYPRSRAACMSWNQAGLRPHGQCFPLTPALNRAFSAVNDLILFRGAPASLRRLVHHGHVLSVGSNVGVGIDLAFARWMLRRPGRRSILCNEFQATWTGPRSGRRPTSFCLDPEGVVARGWLYPLPRSVFELSLQYP